MFKKIFLVFLIVTLFNPLSYAANLSSLNLNGKLFLSPIDTQGIFNIPNNNAQWTLIYLPTSCMILSNCEQKIALLQKLINELNSVSQSVFLLLAVPPKERGELVNFSGKKILSDEDILKLKKALNEIGGLGFVLENKIYLMDNSGHLILYYLSTQDLVDIQADLKHLLEN